MLKIYKRFSKWESRFEQKHPKAYGFMTAVTGLATMALVIILVLLVWAIKS